MHLPTFTYRPCLLFSAADGGRGTRIPQRAPPPVRPTTS